MPTTEVAKRYFAALAAHDLDAAIGCWAGDGVQQIVGRRELVGAGAIRDFVAALLRAFPDLRVEIVEVTTSRTRAAVRWQARATFAGPGRFEGLEPTGAAIELEGCDVLTVADGLIVRAHQYLDSGTLLRQLGVLPSAGSAAERRRARRANLRARVRRAMQGSEAQAIAPGVWIVRGGLPTRTMNVYLLEDEGGVTVFDAGIESMTAAVARAAARLGGIRRIVLGHADADHRGAAPGLAAPVYCHPAEREAAASSSPLRDYWDFGKLDRHGRVLMPRLLPAWDGGAVDVAGTVAAGHEVAGFRVVELPGHAPGLIGLFRQSDRLALVSDCLYTLDPQTGRKREAGVPHPAFNADTEQARSSIRALAALNPSAVWAGHADPVTGDVQSQLDRAAVA